MASTVAFSSAIVAPRAGVKCTVAPKARAAFVSNATIKKTTSFMVSVTFYPCSANALAGFAPSCSYCHQSLQQIKPLTLAHFPLLPPFLYSGVDSCQQQVSMTSTLSVFLLHALSISLIPSKLTTTVFFFQVLRDFFFPPPSFRCRGLQAGRLHGKFSKLLLTDTFSVFQMPLSTRLIFP
jgi:hypothetical protein